MSALASSQDRVRWWHEILFCLNNAYAMTYALVRLSFGELNISDYRYILQRAAVRITAPLHLDFIRQLDIVLDITFAVTMLAVALVLLMVLRMLAASALHRAVLYWSAGGKALFSVPVLMLLAMYLVPGREPEWLSVGLGVKILLAECGVVGLLLLVGTRIRISMWTPGILMTLHYGFWTWQIMDSCMNHLICVWRVFLAPLLFVVVFPASGYVWLLYRARLQAGAASAAVERRSRALIYGVPALVVLCALFLPDRGYSVAHPKDMKSVKITIERGGCFGPCPVYTITVRGDGNVEYVGHVDKWGRGADSLTGASTIPPEQVMQLLRGFDRVHFMSLDDRAFDKCADAPVVEVTIAVDGRQHRVWSEGCFERHGSGPQFELENMADEVDKAVHSAQWISHR